MEEKKPIKRILALCDFACATGFAQVAQNIILQVIQDPEIDYQVDIVAINYYGIPNQWLDLHPKVRLFPASIISNGDLFGRQGFLNLLSSGAYDIAFILQDTFNVEVLAPKMLELRTSLIENGKKAFKFILYFPIDAKPMENWITKSVSLADIPVAYTEYGAVECIKFDPTLKNKLRVVPHGVDINVFNKLPDDKVADFKKKFFINRADGKFLVTNVNRNQPRKDIARTLQVFRLFKNQVPNSVLYLHMKRNDVAYDIAEVARHYELIPDEDYIVPVNFDENQGVSLEILNYIYNVSDVVMTTTLGEGWGFSMTEAMAAGTPVIAPNHTSLTEILGDGRGTLVDAGKSITDWFIMLNDNARMRPLTSVPDFVDKLIGIYHDPAKTNQMAETAYEFVRENWAWNKVGAKWQEIFKQAVPTPKLVKIGRNDPCSCGSGKKYKFCHGQ